MALLHLTKHSHVIDKCRPSLHSIMCKVLCDYSAECMTSVNLGSLLHKPLQRLLSSPSVLDLAMPNSIGSVGSKSPILVTKLRSRSNAAAVHTHQASIVVEMASQLRPFWYLR